MFHCFTPGEFFREEKDRNLELTPIRNPSNILLLAVLESLRPMIAVAVVGLFMSRCP
jgi:hypothetical protein